MRIEQVLSNQPGTSTRGVARAASIDESTADYHLRRLRRSGRVSVERSGRELAWFLASRAFCPVLKGAIPAISRESVAAVARALDTRPRTAADLARRSGRTMGEVRWAALRLREAGLAARTASGRVYLPADKEICMGRALSRSPCDLWGRCAPSLETRSPRELQLTATKI